ncbi:hypothetical protein IC235_11015 [Hymenobacter sp. BT664]|uniref:Uncharacterized protein n=1 Tax=Hymenobacter montanus TaxID=2771359 RepID=A0A927BE78_9BACT|nr:hypothetical protein [Hymenobacter montanus]MBD2768422.1 hypothetical protein [Hymenobacter montanus]
MLARRGLLLVRDGAALAQQLAHHPDKVFAYDGGERGIPRNADRDGQAEEYIAKKSTMRSKFTEADPVDLRQVRHYQVPFGQDFRSLGQPRLPLVLLAARRARMGGANDEAL